MMTVPDITQLGTTLKQLAGQAGAIRVTWMNREGFVVELFDSGDIADHVGTGHDTRFPVAYEKAVNSIRWAVNGHSQGGQPHDQ